MQYLLMNKLTAYFVQIKIRRTMTFIANRKNVDRHVPFYNSLLDRLILVTQLLKIEKYCRAASSV